MKNEYLLVLRAEDEGGPIRTMRKETFDEDERVDVRDLTTRWTTQILAKEISPYRHTLFLDGKAYAILEVTKRSRAN